MEDKEKCSFARGSQIGMDLWSTFFSRELRKHQMTQRTLDFKENSKTVLDDWHKKKIEIKSQSHSGCGKKQFSRKIRGFGFHLRASPLPRNLKTKYGIR